MLRIMNIPSGGQCCSQLANKHLMHWKAMKEQFTGPTSTREHIEVVASRTVVGVVSLVLPRVAYDYPRIRYRR